MIALRPSHGLIKHQKPDGKPPGFFGSFSV
jgi:hypothetical protein